MVVRRLANCFTGDYSKYSHRLSCILTVFLESISINDLSLPEKLLVIYSRVFFTSIAV